MRPFLFSALIALHGPVLGQGRTALGPAQADSLYAAMLEHRIPDLDRRLEACDRLIAYFQQAHRPCELTRTRLSKASAFDSQGKLDSAMVQMQSAERSFDPSCDSALYRMMRVQLTSIYLSLGDLDRVIAISNDLLRRWRADDLDREWRYSVMQNLGIAHDMSGDGVEAGRIFRQVYREALAAGDRKAELDGLVNLGSFKANHGDLDSASRCFASALNLARELDFPEQEHGLTINLALLRSDLGDPDAGMRLLEQADERARASNNLQFMADVERNRAYIQSHRGAWQAAFEHQSAYQALRDSMLNEEMLRAVADVREKYETEKKARENERLRAEKLDAELRNARVKRMRNIYLFSGLGVVLFAGGLWSRLRYTRRSRAAIQKEKDVSEGLLLNILPGEVAAELKQKGRTEARHFDQATILFSDFKGFTRMSEQVGAADLVAEIDHCFKAFDAIMERRRIEKIKTIGDAYMAAGGVPDPAHGSPADVVHAALEMQAFMRAYGRERAAAGRLFFEMRVGIHSGPVVAGVVGVKKFAYDIWGDTVNTASRMESSGEVGRVNISGATHDLVKHEPGLSFTARGRVQAKGKGEMEMYFVREGSGPGLPDPEESD